MKKYVMVDYMTFHQSQPHRSPMASLDAVHDSDKYRVILLALSLLTASLLLRSPQTGFQSIWIQLLRQFSISRRGIPPHFWDTGGVGCSALSVITHGLIMFHLPSCCSVTSGGASYPYGLSSRYHLDLYTKAKTTLTLRIDLFFWPQRTNYAL